MFNDNKQEALDRAKVLLSATYGLLKEQEDSPYVLNILDTLINYDDTVCDGSCLKDDIKYWFDEFVAEPLEE